MESLPNPGISRHSVRNTSNSCGSGEAQEALGPRNKAQTKAESGSASPEAAGYGGSSAAECSTRAVITYIDSVVTFDPASRRFLDESMAESKCRHKTRAIFRAIYRSTTAQVHVQPPGEGDPIKTKPFVVNRGVVQGDILSPMCFTVALECLMRKADAGGGVTML